MWLDRLLLVAIEWIPSDREHGLVWRAAVDGRPAEINAGRNAVDLRLEGGRVEIRCRAVVSNIKRNMAINTSTHCLWMKRALR
jgi:hypothetical protein